MFHGGIDRYYRRLRFPNHSQANIKACPYHDSRYSGGPQKIPGKVLCAYYDLGGEGVAYHDTDAKNHGSGELNPADGTYLNEFRIHEGVDTSYTKFNRKPDQIDDNPFDKIVPPADLLYVGWSEPGEWFNLTVDVAQSRTYAADFLYTSNRDNPDRALAQGVKTCRSNGADCIRKEFASCDHEALDSFS
ncbi:MAG TPA: hypothetical protein VK722_04530 [Candidatus Aquilonibacter sp.]|jgi:hypothetical protein|nr:hypothetical protein [Candidatus Aquilonibacter sp.]